MDYMKLNKKQKRVLISIPIFLLVFSGIFALFDWMMGGDHEAIVKAFRFGLSVGSAWVVFGILSLLFNWPWNLRDDNE
jgi:hypothetical protein